MHIEAIERKIDYYMQNYILPKFNIEKIHWFFSISGGKDSYVLAKSINEWYKRNNKKITATGIHIIQWDDGSESIRNKFNWLDDLLIIDERQKTAEMIKENASNQAPCSKCSNIRKIYTDMFFKQMSANEKGDNINILCRGLHLTDLANSMLWRLIYEESPIDSIIKNNKGQPIVKLFSNLYLAKPLCFVREFESQEYAFLHGYIPYQCNCPALKYPSRRDIIEESVKMFYKDPIWEFTIPGMDIYFDKVLNFDLNIIKECSEQGMEKKQPTLPDGFFSYAKDYFLSKIECNRSILLSNVINKNIVLEEYVPDFLSLNLKTQMTDLNINFKLLYAPECLSDFDLRMIATLGPLWAAFALDTPSKNTILQYQEHFFNYRLNISWCQVTDLLCEFYNSIDTKKSAK